MIRGRQRLLMVKRTTVASHSAFDAAALAETRNGQDAARACGGSEHACGVVPAMRIPPAPPHRPSPGPSASAYSFPDAS